MAERQVIVVGGGAAGLFAAGHAARAGARSLLLEKTSRTGRKLCITGKGRCNLTNVAELTDFITHFGKTGNFLRQAFSRYFSEDLMAFFEELGLDLARERGGRVFPASGRAPDVHAALVQWLKQEHVRVKTSTPVDQLVISHGRLTGLLSRGKEFPCDAAILATGGASYPATGSTGDGYRLARSAGHHIVPPRPALVPLETGDACTGRMNMLNLRNVAVRLLADGKKRKDAFGELLFTESGVSGPTILTLSSFAVDLMQQGHDIKISIDLKPALDDKKLDARLRRDLAARGKEPLASLLRGLLPGQMVPVCLDLTGINGRSQASRITADQRKQLRLWLKDFRLDVTGHRPIDEAIVTAGGVDTKEVDPRTMESRKIKGLFFAGELLDFDADTGGYNLQAAFSTGWLAGRSAAGAHDQ